MCENKSPRLYIGVDVGSTSARSALVDQDGTILKTSERSIRIWEPSANYYEQSSDDIWNAVCETVKNITGDVDVTNIRGIGFDATCSLVVLDTSFHPLSISTSGDNDRNIIMWMDHRAHKQADFINSTKHDILKYVGGAISLEQEPPKLLWLKQNLRKECWDKAGHFLDLADYLTWRATGSLTRSLGTLVTKWLYLADETSQNFSEDFLQQIGLHDLYENNCSKIGSEVQMPGLPVGKGLSAQSASELGLILGTPVGAGLVDAYAGGLGVIACDVKGHNLACENQPITSRLPIICGTSTCHMAISDKPIFVDRVWGPFYSSMVPKFWVTEGGQSATGKLLDHIVQTHPAYNELKQQAQESNSNIYQVLNERVSSLGEKSHMKDQVGQLTTNLHIWPDFHGNRSPLADASLKGMICGLTLSTDIDNLAVLYLATIQAIAFGTRHILDALNGSGHDISTLIACGGLSKNSLFMQIHSDVTGLPVILPKEIESVLLGASMLGACASSDYSNIQEVMEKMSKVGHVVRPNCREREYYNKKYKVFLKMVEDQKVYQNMMK